MYICLYMPFKPLKLSPLRLEAVSGKNVAFPGHARHAGAAPCSIQGLIANK